MKSVMLMAAAACISFSALGQDGPVRIQYEPHVTSVDVAGAALNAALQTELAEKNFDVRAEQKPPKFRFRLRTLPLTQLNQYVTLYEALWLMEDTDGSELYVNSWVGYAGTDKAKEQATDVVRDMLTRIAAMRKAREGK